MKTTTTEQRRQETFGSVNFTDPQSMDYLVWTTEMDYLNGKLNGLPKWNTLNYPLWKKKKNNQSSVVLIDGPLPSQSFSIFAFFLMLVVSCSRDAFIRPA